MAYITLEVTAIHADAPGTGEQDISGWTGTKPSAGCTAAC
jgi:hypothetical protein